MHAKAPYRGQCLCGAVKYEFDTISPQMGHCHCSMCRKFHGAAFATLGEVPKADFRWIQGEQQLQSYTAKNRTIRRFCGHCGSSMSFEAPGHESLIEVALGTVDTPIPQQPDVHIFTKFKADWYEIKDPLPRFLHGRNSKQIKEDEKNA